MKINKNVLASIVAISLTACGGSDDTPPNTTPPNTTPPITTPPITTPPITTPPTDLEVRLSKINVNIANDSDICGTQTKTMQTKHFTVSADYDSVTEKSLDQLARLTQLALDDLIVATGLDAVDDLFIDDNNSWTACLTDTIQAGNGTAYPRKFEVNMSGDTERDFQLTVHETFHIIQSALLNEEAAFLHLPYWFQEATAEYFANKVAIGITAPLIEQFLDDTDTSPINIEYYNQEVDIRKNHPQYQTALYDIYLKSLNYLQEHELTDTDILSLIRESYDANNNQDGRIKFDDAMTVLESAGMTLPTNFTNLKTVPGYYDHVVEAWLANNIYSAGFTADLEMYEIYLINTENDYGFSASVNWSEGTYTYNTTESQDGDYDIYGMTPNEIVYGPINKSIIDGQLGDVDFTGADVCTTELCLED